MLKTHEKFHSLNGKRLVLIVDDEEINRELLNIVLQEEYETLLATDGESALQLIRERADTLSLILLDLLMPGMHGMEVLRTLKNDQDLKNIPVIVLTADQEAEVSSLQLGAADFISKPYPKKEVILTRVARSIELSEDTDIIQSTERDKLTGLYNREYFYRYAQQFDQHHKDLDMDAIVIDIHHFRMINERYGKAYGDEVLRRISEKVREMVRDSGGIVCRQEADTFLVYCPHREDYAEILENASIGLAEGEASGNRVRLRMGVYEHVDHSIEMERRFDRAKIAADTVRGNFLKGFAMYDNRLHESEIYAEQLLEDFEKALAQRQFTVFYQPKFDIRPEIPVLASAEALVRWQHPEMGMISPGVFIPLFEDNGLIQQLDLYVWREAAAQIRDWKKRLGISVPVSVNVSRVDMYDPNLISTFQQLLEEYDLAPGELLLEITESAYTQDSAQIISTVNRLRELGFRIEMDDFGTGYSSLNMISSLPIDALKLDMKFIRNAFQDGKDTRLIEVIIDIADYLSVPVIAEGVETKEQLDALRAMGCDLVQGYYFSKPVPPEEYEFYMEQKKQQLEQPAEKILPGEHTDRMTEKRSVSASIVHALTDGFEVIYYIDTDSGQYVQFSAQGRYEDLQIERSGRDFFGDTQRNIPRVIYPEDQERVALSMQKETLLAQLMGGCSFSMTYRLVMDGQPVYYNLRAVNALTKDEHHIVIGVSNIDAQMKRQMEYDAAKAQTLTYSRIAEALSRDYYSIYLVNTETDEFIEYSSNRDYQVLQVEQSGEDFFEKCRLNILRLVYEEDRELALSVWDKGRLMSELEDGRTFSITYRLVVKNEPVYINCKVIRMEDQNDSHYLVIGISNVNEQMKRERELYSVREKANRDALTGVKSKLAYVETMNAMNQDIANGVAESFAVAVCDVNGLKTVNDTLGHQAGDRLIQEASHSICETFKHSPVFRIGGDEFVAILRGADYERRDALISEMAAKNVQNQQSGGVIIACGCGQWMAEQDSSFDDVFARADAAMYENKAVLKN